jgi:hypothetical protein
LNRRYAILAAVLLILVITISLFFTVNPLSKKASNSPFYVGVEFAYGNQFSQLKPLVDQVKNYTNLFVIGSVYLTFNRTALDESCDYLFNSGLNFIVLFTSFAMYNDSNGWSGYTIFNWIADAKQKYGDQFLGFYRFDEPGGNQLDKGTSMFIKNTRTFSYPDNATGYAEVAESYVGNLSTIVGYYLNHTNYTTKIFTADYGLFWFDYESGYNTVLAEFVGNQSRQQITALDRGAAQSFNEDWGVIINWKYDQPPYLESGDELYSDLSLAYSEGAKYAVVFSYPNVTNYGTLTQQHFDALERFWNNMHNNPGSFASSNAEVAYVIPKDYGFGFRNPNDTIWGLFPSDLLTPKIWADTTTLLNRYGTNLNIIYGDPGVIGSTLNNYTKVFYWNQTIT